VFAEAEPNSFCLLFSGESSSLSVHGVYCGVSRRLSDLSIEPVEDHPSNDSRNRFNSSFPAILWNVYLIEAMLQAAPPMDLGCRFPLGIRP